VCGEADLPTLFAAALDPLRRSQDAIIVWRIRHCHCVLILLCGVRCIRCERLGAGGVRAAERVAARSRPHHPPVADCCDKELTSIFASIVAV
jgi:hypothetical protein